ncbi:conserved Plasmodium protein, unknown function [Plasmodium gaboni]|uniref:Apicoplast integral membrane protein n=1 Tax=Plasmodium gaboni TaxID=647221 RepID=A0ABY1UI69_9APIC|nr:conserved Plasmodium protein, unknown function [Plasmodium gaboni]
MVRLKTNKKAFYVFVSVSSLFGYFLKGHKEDVNNYETLINNNDIDKIKKIRIHNKCSYIPLLFLNIYDSYIYKNKILRWLYFKCRKRRKDKEEYYYITDMIRKKRREQIKYNFISDEQNLFNKLYIYEIVLEYSLKYGILSPHLSLYILKNISEYCVNLYPSLYDTNKERDIYNNFLNKKKLTYSKQINNEHNYQVSKYNTDNKNNIHNNIHIHNNNNNNNNQLNVNMYYNYNNTFISSHSLYNNMETKNINIFNKYNIHNFYSEKYTCYKNNKNDQHITLNMIYLLNQAYDNISRICLNTNTNIYINFYMINILKYICFYNIEDILLNYNHIEHIKKKMNEQNNTNISFFKFLYSFFFFKKKEKHIYHLVHHKIHKNQKKGNQEFYNNYSNQNRHNNINTHMSDNYLFDHINNYRNGYSFKNSKKMNTNKNDNNNNNKKNDNNNNNNKKNDNNNNNKKDILKKIYFLKGYKLDDIQILNELYIMIYMRLLFECSLKLISIKKNIHLLEKKMQFDKENKIIYLNSADCMNNLRTNFLKRFNKYEEREKKKIDDPSKIYTTNISDYFKGEKKKDKNEDNIINICYIKKKISSFIFYLKNIIINKDTSFIENNNIVNDNIKKNNFLKSFMSYLYIKDIYEYNYELRLYYIYSNLRKLFLKYVIKMNEHIDIKLYKIKRALNYYIYNFDQFLINNYYHLIHQKNIHKINIHLKYCKDKDIDILKFNDLYYFMINNINNIFSYIQKMDHKKCVYKIFKTYNKILLYQYNYLNEKENMYYKNKIKKYLIYLNNNICNDLNEYNKSYDNIKNFSHIFFYTLKNDINLLLFLFTQRIQNCCDIFCYIYKKYNFIQTPFLNYLFYELRYIVYSQKNKKKFFFFFFITPSAYSYDNIVNSFNFSYFFFSLSYLLFILFYHPNMYTSFLFFKTLIYSGIPTYYYNLYNNIIAVMDMQT